MKNFIEKRPFLFGLIITLIIFVSGILVVVPGRMLGIPQDTLIMIILVVASLIPLGIIWRLGWWEDAGFVGAIQNPSALLVPVLMMPFPIVLFGTIGIEASVTLYWLVAVFLTGLSEETLSRGLFIRVFLPHGKWKAVLYPALLFGLSHLSSLFGSGMDITANLYQIILATMTAILVAAVRLRTNNIWPLIITHTLFDLFFVLAGLAGTNATRTLADVPLPAYVALWVVEIATAVYLMSKPVVATIDGKPVG